MSLLGLAAVGAWLEMRPSAQTACSAAPVLECYLGHCCSAAAAACPADAALHSAEMHKFKLVLDTSSFKVCSCGTCLALAFRKGLERHEAQSMLRVAAAKGPLQHRAQDRGTIEQAVCANETLEETWEGLPTWLGWIWGL